MQSIFAEAYQMSIGRDPSTMKKGQQALEELYKAMENGNVYSSKILPYVETIAKRMAAPGLDEARNSSIAERSRFMNMIGGFWRNFSQGGGDAGMANFWRSMQRMGEWFETKGSLIGLYFEIFTVYFDGFLKSLEDIYKFATTGESTSLTDWLKKNGWDVDGIRTAIVGLFDGVGEAFTEIRKSLGFEEGKTGEEISKRIIRFANDMVIVIRSLTDMVKNILGIFQAANEFSDLSVAEKAKAFMNPFSKGAELQRDSVANALGLAWNTGKGTLNVVDTITGVITPSGANKPTTEVLDSARANVLSNHGEMFPGTIPMYTPSMQRQFGDSRTLTVRIEASPEVLNTIDGQALQRAIVAASVDAPNQ